MNGLRSLETLLVDELLLQQRAGAQNQVRGMMQDTSGSIAEQNEQQLAAGAQQMVRPKLEARMMKERQDQARQRQALAGIAGQSAPNMARMADGGIVGYAEGGPAQEEPGMLDKIKQGLGGLFGGEEEAAQKPFDVEGRVMELIKLREGADEQAKARIDQELSGFDPQDVINARIKMSQGMQAGGVVGFQSRGFVDADELEEEYNLTPEGVDRLLDLDELTEEAQEVETESQSERERPPTAAERRAMEHPITDAIVEYVKDNPLQALSMAALAPTVGGLALGAGRLGLAGLTGFAPRAGSALSKLFTRPNPNVVRGPGFTMRPPGQGLRTFSPTRTGATLGVAGLLADQAMRGGGDGEVAAEEVAAAPAPREPTAQEKLGSAVFQSPIAPSAKFKAGEPAQGRGRDIDIDRLISFLQGGAGQQNIAGALAGGSRADIAYQQGERKRQDELKALDEMRKLEREKIGATIGAAEIRAQAATAQKRAEAIMEYITTQPGIISRQSKIDAGMSPEEADRAVQREAEILADRVFGASSGLGSMQGLNVTPAMLAADEALGIN